MGQSLKINIKFLKNIIILFIILPFDAITLIAKLSSKAEIYPNVIIPGNLGFPLASVMYSTMATAPPALQINLAKSGDYFAISLIQVAANFLTNISVSFNLKYNWKYLYKILGKISASTTTSANSTACLEILAKHEQTYLFN